jgi:hypothetical protein
MLEAITEIVALPAVTRVWVSRPIENLKGGNASVSSGDAKAVRQVIDTISTADSNSIRFDVVAEE